MQIASGLNKIKGKISKQNGTGSNLHTYRNELIPVLLHSITVLITILTVYNAVHLLLSIEANLNKAPKRHFSDLNSNLAQ